MLRLSQIKNQEKNVDLLKVTQELNDFIWDLSIDYQKKYAFLNQLEMYAAKVKRIAYHSGLKQGQLPPESLPAIKVKKNLHYKKMTLELHDNIHQLPITHEECIILLELLELYVLEIEIDLYNEGFRDGKQFPKQFVSINKYGLAECMHQNNNKEGV